MRSVHFEPRESKLQPEHCVWELTLACNLRCKHCGSRAGKQRTNEMTLHECLSLVEQLAGLGTKIVTLSGGEPTLHKDWYKIACAIRDNGMIANMVTNGYEMDQNLASLMKKAELANVAISIDGTERSHDKVRGEGSFQKSLKSLKILGKAGVTTAVITTINSYNIDELHDLHSILLNFNVNLWRLHLGTQIGNMKDNNDLIVGPDELLKLLPLILKIKENSPIDVGIGDNLGYHSIYDAKLRAFSWEGKPQCWGGCQAGLKVIGIESDGNVKGCLSIQPDGYNREQFSEGNIKERSLESIWFDKKCFQLNREFSSSQLKGYCRKCRYRHGCKGGAKCVAIASTGKAWENPYCYYRVSQLANKHSKQPHLGHIAAATAAAGILILGGYPEKVSATEPVCSATVQINLPESCFAAYYGIVPPGTVFNGALTGNLCATESGDPAHLGGAKITLTRSNEKYIVFTDNDGTFHFPSVEIGIYDVSIELDGFETVTMKNIGVCRNDTTTVQQIKLTRKFPWVLFLPAITK